MISEFGKSDYLRNFADILQNSVAKLLKICLKRSMLYMSSVVNRFTVESFLALTMSFLINGAVVAVFAAGFFGDPSAAKQVGLLSAATLLRAASARRDLGSRADIHFRKFPAKFVKSCQIFIKFPDFSANFRKSMQFPGISRNSGKIL